MRKSVGTLFGDICRREFTPPTESERGFVVDRLLVSGRLGDSSHPPATECTRTSVKAVYRVLSAEGILVLQSSAKYLLSTSTTDQS